MLKTKYSTTNQKTNILEMGGEYKRVLELYNVQSVGKWGEDVGV